MHKTRKLCAIMIDTIGRELLINREAKLDESGWPVHEHVLSVKVNDKVPSATSLLCPNGASTNFRSPDERAIIWLSTLESW